MKLIQDTNQKLKLKIVDLIKALDLVQKDKRAVQDKLNSQGSVGGQQESAGGNQNQSQENEIKKL